MEKNIIEKDNNIKKAILIDLKLLILFTPLVVYKNVNFFRANQEAWLKLFVLIGMILWVFKFLIIKEVIWEKSKMNLLICIFILIISLSLLISEYLLVSLRDYVIFISYFLIYFLIKYSVENKNEFNSFLRLFFVTSFLVSIYTLLHYYGLISYLREFGPVVSTIGQKNLTSNYLALIFPLIFSFFLIEQKRKNKILYYLLLVIIYAALMICQSRGIWISISVTLLIGIFLIFKFKLFKIFKENKKWLVLLFISFLIITVIYSTDNPLNKSAITVTERALSTFDEQDPSINTRILIWKNTLQMIKDRPLFGIGIGTFKMNYLDYKAKFLKDNPYYTKYSSNPNESHNEYLQIGAELGITGLGIFSLILLVFYNSTLNYLKREISNKKKIIVFCLIMGVTCFLIHSFFSFPLHVPALGSAFFIIIALTVIYIRDFHFSGCNKPKNGNRIKLKKQSSKLTILFTILILFITIFIIDSLIIRPYLAEVYADKGYENFKLGNYDKAIYSYEYATKLDPYNGRILLSLGATYYNLTILDEAVKILKNAKKYINDRNIYRNLGLCYMKLERFKEAEEEFKHAIYLDPEFSKAYVNLGNLYFLQENYNGAIEQWSKILEIDLNYSDKYIILANLGIVYNKKEMPDKALEYFVQALQLVPEGSPIEEEIEKEINKIYKSKLKN